MPFAIELDMDDHAAAAVRQVWHALVNAGVPSAPLSLGMQPHVSLCVYESLDSALAVKQLENFARPIGTIPFELETVETFAGSKGVVFLAPRPSEALSELHARFHRDFAGHRATASQYYLSGNWKPHCTVAENLSPAQVSQAIEICRKTPLPIRGAYVQIGLLEFRPIKQICAFEIGKK
jgi:2'-5' RNA ligase